MPETAKATICNRRGLHARASAKFVKIANQYEARVTVEYNGYAVEATSIMGLMMLAAAPGAEISLSAEGPDADAAIAALQALIADRFGEDQDQP